MFSMSLGLGILMGSGDLALNTIDLVAASWDTVE